MKRLYRFLIPRDFGLTADERRAVLKDAARVYHARGFAYVSILFAWIVILESGGMGIYWIVQAASWPAWAFYAMFGPTFVFAALMVLRIDLLLGFRRAIYEALIRRGHSICPRCGYSRSGLASDCDCPECGANPDTERWDMATLNLWERIRFRHIDHGLRLPFEVRRSVIRRAWYRLRQDNLQFALYLLGVVLIVTTGVAGHRLGAWGVLGVLGGLGIYLWMERRLLARHVRSELHARGYPIRPCGYDTRDQPPDAPCPECRAQLRTSADSPPSALPSPAPRR